MSSQEKFDDLIRKKFDEKQFAFSEKNWEKAEKKLNSDRRSKKIFWWSLLFISGIISGMFIMLPINKKNKTNLTYHESVENTEKENLNTKIRSNQSVNLKTNANNNGELKNDVPSEIKNNIINNKLDAENKNQLNIENRNNEKKLVGENILENKISMNTTTSKNRLNKEKNEVEEWKANYSEENLNELKVKEEPSLSAGKYKMVNLTNTANHLNTAKKRKKIVGNKTIKQTNDLVSVLYTLENMGIPLLGIDSIHKQIINPFKSFQNKSDLKSVTINNAGLGSSTIYSLDIGTNYELGWVYKDKKEGKGFNPILGLGVTLFYNSKWSLCIGAQYGSIAYLKTSEKKFTTKNYSFGINYSDTIITTKWLHYAVLPLMVQYHVNNKNSFSIGGSVSYLVNSINTISYDKRISDPNHTNSSVSYTNDSSGGNKKLTNGYYSNDFNYWDASLMMGYRRRLSEKFNIAAIANIGLLDIKKNLIFNENKRERNSGIKIIISYNLFKIK